MKKLKNSRYTLTRKNKNREFSFSFLIVDPEILREIILLVYILKKNAVYVKTYSKMGGKAIILFSIFKIILFVFLVYYVEDLEK